jgi:hypothetical protein
MRVMFRLTLAALAVAALATVILSGSGSSSHSAVVPAHADSGFCGVRNDQFLGVADNMVYVVRNKCASAITVKVYFTEPRRYADPGCLRIPAGRFGYFTSIYATNNWVVRNC